MLKPEKGIKAMRDGCRSCEHRPSGAAGDSDRLSGHSGPGSDDATTLRVTGLDWADEVAGIERVLKPLAAIRGVRTGGLRPGICLTRLCAVVE